MTRFAGADSAIQTLFAPKTSPRYDDMGILAQRADSAVRRSGMEADANADIADIMGVAKLKEAEAMAEGIKAQGQAAGQSAMAGGLGSMFSGIAGGIGSIGGGGGGGSFGSMSSFPGVNTSNMTGFFNPSVF